MSSLDSAAPKQPSPSSRAKRYVRTGIVLAISIGLLSYASAGIWQKYHSTHNPHPLPGKTTVTNSLSNPDETPIRPTDTYAVPADQPHSITLPSITARGLVQKVGIDQHGAIAVPSNVHVAGWFVGNDTPGQKGLSIIDGHVQGKYQPGVFKQLSKLRGGDTFGITFGDKSTKQFEVVSVTSYPTDQVNKHLFARLDDIASQLNLITCGGRYNKDSGQYDERVLVVSKLLM